MLLLHKMKRRVHAYVFFNISLGFLSAHLCPPNQVKPK